MTTHKVVSSARFLKWPDEDDVVPILTDEVRMKAPAPDTAPAPAPVPAPISFVVPVLTDVIEPSLTRRVRRAA